MAGVRVGVAYVDVVPNMETFGTGLAAGATAGIAKAAPSIKASMTAAMGNITGGLSKLKSAAMGVLGGGILFLGLDMLAKKSVAYGQAVERIVATFGAQKADATEFKAIVDATGGSADMVAKVLVRLDAQFTKLGASSGAGAANLMSYGLSQDMLSVKTNGLIGVMDNLATAYANAADKQAFIASTLGPRGMNMAPVLDQWNALRKGVEALGLDWDKVAPSKATMQQFEVMQIGLQAVEVMIGNKVIPIVTRLGKALDVFLRDVAEGANPVKAFFKDLVFGVDGVTGVFIKFFAIVIAAKVISALTLIVQGMWGLGSAIVKAGIAAFGTSLTFDELALSIGDMMGMEVAAMVTTAALAAEFIVIFGAIADVVGILYELKLALDIKKYNAEADLSDIHTAMLQVGLDIRNGVPAAEAFGNALEGMSMQQLAIINQHPEIFQQELNMLFEDGKISLADYTKFTMGLGKSQAQVDAEVQRMTRAIWAQQPAVEAVTKKFKALWGQMQIGSKNLALLAGAAGVTGTALKAGLAAAIDSIATDGGKAFGDFVQSTEEAMRSWAESIAASFSGATSNFDNLAKKSHQTMQYILADAVKEARDQAQIARDVQVIAQRAGTSSAAVLQYMADHGITSVRELNAVVQSSPAAFKAFQQAIKSSADSVQAGSLPILNVANEQFMKLIDSSGVLDKLNTVIHLDHSQIDSSGKALRDIINMLGGVGGGRLTIGVTAEDGSGTPGGSGRPGDYGPSTAPTRGSVDPRHRALFHHGLALGGLVTGPIVAPLGEHGPELVLPLAGLGGRQKGPTHVVGDLHINWDEGVARMVAIAQDEVDDERDYQESVQRMARG